MPEEEAEGQEMYAVLLNDVELPPADKELQVFEVEEQEIMTRGRSRKRKLSCPPTGLNPLKGGASSSLGAGFNYLKSMIDWAVQVYMILGRW